MSRRLLIGRHVGLGTAMENDTPKEGDESELPEHADSVEAQLAEVAEDSAEVEQHNERVEEAIDGAESLEAMCVTLSAAMEAGGLDPHAAELMNQHAQYVLGRTGFDSSKTTMALESFGAVSDRVHSTNVAMESFKDTIRAMWDKIIEALKKAMEWVKNLYNKMFGIVEGLAKRAKKLADAAEAAAAKQRDKESFENEAVAQKLAIGNKVDAIAGLDVLKKVVPAAASANTKEFVNDLLSAFGDIANGNPVEGNKAMIKARNKLPESPYSLTEVANPKSEGFKVAADAKVKRGEQLPGRQAIILIEVGNFMNFSLGKYKPNDNTTISKTLKTLSPSDVGTIAEKVEELAKQLQSFRKDESFNYDAKKKALDAAKKIADREVKEDEKANEKTIYKDARRYMTTFANLVDEPDNSIIKHTVVTCQAALAYGELSLRQYK